MTDRERFRLNVVDVGNRVERPFSVDVTVQKDGEPVFDRTVEIDAADGSKLGTYRVSAPWMDELARYETTVRASGDSLTLGTDRVAASSDSPLHDLPWLDFVFVVDESGVSGYVPKYHSREEARRHANVSRP
ncbi:hypothetical protein [Halorussus sp. MSC15.2]|uniref:hypothetical protein n=1 Tax=Halorussus sp. MSC15.2 TaxID=2283638 RepID=UPI0013D7C64D|nr:hypothetical protein [Halorussus sp. MSC15.2]NEU58382.1 hypothetical protein [Halorussus sp. MSC15.2]